MHNILCPVSLSANVALLETIPAERICQLYTNALNIDVKENFRDIKYIQKFKCDDTGYVFFHPFSIAGSEALYQQLEKNAWYYQDGKWEHTEVLKFIGKEKAILEIGSGDGSFLSLLRENNYRDAVGLELNKEAIARAKEKGLFTLNYTIEQYAAQISERVDVVCLFQVLEHIAEVKPFIQASLQTLKSGGKLIISVPNNDSFIKYDKENALNYPPHHMGRWNTESLRNLSHCFPIKLQELLYEPLQAYHVNWYTTVFLKRIFGIRIFYRFINNRFLTESMQKIFNRRRDSIKGHSVVAIYQKL